MAQHLGEEKARELLFSSIDYVRMFERLCRAQGGFKFRRTVQLSDEEIERQASEMGAKLSSYMVSAAVQRSFIESNGLLPEYNQLVAAVNTALGNAAEHMVVGGVTVH
jgi:hypothetical protein